MLKFLRRICLMAWALSPCVAHAGLMVNVEYIHQLIARDWGLEIKYNPGLSTPKVAANMKYLLTTVDVANQMLNGQKITDYGNGEFATLAAADTVATNEAVRRLIKIEPKFWVTTTDDTSEFKFGMSAKGTFQVFWGDGTNDVIVRRDTNAKTYSHKYAAPGEYKIGFGGRATKYNYTGAPTISFRNNLNVAGISGSLGAIFSTVGNPTVYWTGQQPVFLYTFSGCKKLSGVIPPELFQGVHGLPVANMFNETFYTCVNLTGEIPENLFSGLDGKPANSIFHYTFLGCRGLSGPIPEKLFAGIKGEPAVQMFQNTFGGCSGLTGSIPHDLFAGIKGPPAENMFSYTFARLNLSGKIPDDLFAGIQGTPADGMFAGTFSACFQLTGESAKINGIPLYDVWPDATVDQVGNCYSGVSRLTDFSAIPATWK